MRIISKKALREFWLKHADAEESLLAWYRVVKAATWRHLADVKTIYPHADLVGDLTVFNIKGNDYRLIVRINYVHQVIYIKAVETHANYDKDRWK